MIGSAEMTFIFSPIKVNVSLKNIKILLSLALNSAGQVAEILLIYTATPSDCLPSIL